MVANILSPRQQMEAKDREEGGGKGREGAVSSDGDGGTTGAAGGGVSLDGQEDGDCPFDQLARDTSSLFGKPLEEPHEHPSLHHSSTICTCLLSYFALILPHLGSQKPLPKSLSTRVLNRSHGGIVELFAWWPGPLL
jgi:hypothetical protein